MGCGLEGNQTALTTTHFYSTYTRIVGVQLRPDSLLALISSVRGGNMQSEEIFQKCAEFHFGGTFRHVFHAWNSQYTSLLLGYNLKLFILFFTP